MCGGCWAVLEGRDIRTPGLSDVAWIADELATTMSRMDRVGGASVGRVGGAGELPLPVNLKAGEQIRDLRAYLGLWVRDLWDTYGPHTQVCFGCGVEWHTGEPDPGPSCTGTAHDWDVMVADLDVDDEPVALSRWLMRHPTWIRGHAAAADLHEELLGVFASARRTIDTITGKTYLGRCSTVVDTEEGPVECPESIYAARDATEVACRTCGTRHDLSARRARLLAAVEDEYVPTSDLVGLVTGLGRRVTSDMVRSLKRRGRIKPWVYDEAAGWWRPKTEADSDWPNLYRVGDVLDAITVNRYKREVS